MKQNLLVRFPPSPTGMLHIGNARVAFINYLFAKKYGAKYAMRFDDTDVIRSKEEYKTAMLEDLAWLGINFDYETVYQSKRTELYNDAVQKLLKTGRVYECFETKEELELKKKVQTSRGLPLIYDRTSLNITKEQRQKFLDEGRVPYYRFLIKHEETSWEDGVQGRIEFHGKDITDPIITRTDGSFMYAFCSIVDDFLMDVTHIIRGADHITNTAVQKQMFEALCVAFGQEKSINFFHLPLFQAKEGKISKRVGGFGIRELVASGIEKKAILNFLANLGKSTFSDEILSTDELIKGFNITDFSKATVTYTPEVLENFNLKCLASYEYAEVSRRLQEIPKEFFDDFKHNIAKLEDIKIFWKNASSNEFYVSQLSQEEKNFFEKFITILNKTQSDDWNTKWNNAIEKLKSEFPQKKGKELFMPLRIGFSGMEHGVDLKTFAKWKIGN
jgi:glutamyl-tRNA synthetase